MLTDSHKAKRVEWAINHLNDNWETTLFSDETAFNLFRNTIRQWYKGPKPIPKIDKRFLLGEASLYEGKTPLCFVLQILLLCIWTVNLCRHLTKPAFTLLS